MKSKLDNIDYPEFIDYLNNRGIKYTENKDIDECLGFQQILEVTPKSKQLKARIFSTDGGWQMFYGVNYDDEF